MTKERSDGFLAEDKIDHNGEIFNYIQELHEYLWTFVNVFCPGGGGSLCDCIDRAVDRARFLDSFRK